MEVTDHTEMDALYTPGPNATDLTPNKDGGVLKEILKEGISDDMPMSGDSVSVHYIGTLAEDGSKFDSSRDRDEPFKFTLGKAVVIKAWDIGIATMKMGEICRLTCRSNYAYGVTGSPPKIPPYACLIFEVELLDWCGEDLSQKEDGGITRRKIDNGEGVLSPNEGALVDVKIIGRVKGNVFDDREIKFTLGEGTEHNIPEGLEKAIERFKKNEKSAIKLKPKYCFGSGGRPELGVPPHTDVEYEVHLRDFEKAKETWKMDPEEKVLQAKVCKEKGTSYFKQQKYRLAIKQYKKIVEYLQFDSGLSSEMKEERKNVLLAGHLNLSMSHLKLDDFKHAREHATKALEIDPKSVKAYFRRGQAFLSMSEAESALNDFKRCLESDPSNKAALQQLQECHKIIKKQKSKEKQLYGGMFEKFAKTDAKRLAASRSNGDVMTGDLGEWQHDDQDPDQDQDQDRIEDMTGSEHDLNFLNVQML